MQADTLPTGITRFDYERGEDFQGYRVLVRRAGETFCKYFGDASYGGRDEALICALALLRTLERTLAPLKHRSLSQIKKCGSTMVGSVYHYGGFWNTKVGSTTVKFSTKCHGYNGARRLAKAKREELNGEILSYKEVRKLIKEAKELLK